MSQGARKRKTGGRHSLIDTPADEQGRTYGDRVILGIRAGAYQREAANAIGISERVVQRWIARGQEWIEAEEEGETIPEREQRYVRFCREYERAKAEARQSMLTVVRRAAMGSPARLDQHGNVIEKEREPQWTAAAWYLERTMPEHYGRKERHELTGAEGQPLSLADLTARVHAEDAPED